MSNNKHINISLLSFSSTMLEETTEEIAKTLKANGTDSSSISTSDIQCDSQGYAITIDIINPPSKAVEALLMIRLPDEVEISLDIIPEAELKC